MTQRTHPFIAQPELRVDHWSTPKWLLELLFPDGRFYDPCPLGATSGLELEWPRDVPVFINPPYSDVRPWIHKASHHPGEVMLLVRADPSTGWWAYSEGYGWKVTLIGQRLRFGSGTRPASFPSAIWRRRPLAEAVHAAVCECRPA